MITALSVIFGLIGVIIAALVVTFLVLSHLHGKRQDLAQNWEAEYGVQQVQRAYQKTEILFRIGGPECPDGTYSPLQLKLWEKYNDLDMIDRALTEWERDQIVELQGYS